MNYFNPYYYSVPMNIVQPKVGLLGRLFGRAGVSIGNFLNGTQKVLNIANQTIPIVKQVRPMIGNTKTVFKVMNEFRKVNIPTTTKNVINTEKPSSANDLNTTSNNKSITLNEITDGPTFFA